MNKIIVLLIQLLIAANVTALQIVTEIDPPYNFLDKDSNPAGLFVEIVQEIQKRTGNKDEIRFYPWARAFQMAQTEENVIIFSMARTKERQGLFHWIGPVLDNSWVLVAKKESTLAPKNLEEAKNIQSIGVYRNDSRDVFLTNHNFKNLHRSNSNNAAFKMLLANRIKAIATVDITLEDLLKDNNSKTEDIKIIQTLKTVQVFIAISKATSMSVVNEWRKAFQEISADGTYEKIFKSYFPKRQLPGPMNDELL